MFVMQDTTEIDTPVLKGKYLKRMRNLVRCLREAPEPRAFDMGQFGWDKYDEEVDPLHKCGTPACALGHYAARRDLQRSFVLRKNGLVRATSGEGPLGEAAQHFGLSSEEVYHLFEYDGCGGAGTDISKAIDYIESFINRRT
ncbi:MAG: hypothetical protein QNJ97_17730 [Myxococcota bacterium]|nr:hypothetical protein [Myxococcota bacterium]